MQSEKSKLIQVSDTAYYLPDRMNAGIVKGTGNACLVIDTGIDKSSANRIHTALEAEGLRPVALLVTHTHADHCGGNEALQLKYGIPAYCPAFESAILSFPVFEPVYLYGAAPPEALLNKFFVAPKTADAHSLQSGRQEIGGVPITAVDLAGHSPGHAGYLTDDGVLFCGDAIFPDYVWEKYRLPYFYDIDAALKSFDEIERMAGNLTACVAAHYGEVDAAQLARINREGLMGLAKWAEAALMRAPASREDIVAAAINEFGLQQNESQYYLVGSTVAALLTHLTKAGRATATMAEGRLMYHTVQG